MKAVVSHGAGDIRSDDVPDTVVQTPEGAVIRLTSGAICGTDLHLVRGTMAGMTPGTMVRGVLDAYEAFDDRRPGRLKVELETAA